MKEVPSVSFTFLLPQNVLKQCKMTLSGTCTRYLSSLLDIYFSLVLIYSTRSVEVYPDRIFSVGSCRWKRLTE